MINQAFYLRSTILVFIFATAVNLRFRPSAAPVHLGGAEFAIAPYDFAYIVIIFFWIQLLRLRKVSVKKDIILFAAICFVFFSFVSIMKSEAVEYSFYEFARQIKVVFLFVMLRSIFRKITLIETVLFSAATLIYFELFYSVFQLMTGGTDDTTGDATEFKDLLTEGGIVRVSGTLRHPTLLSLYINLLLPFLIFGIFHLKNRLYYLVSVIIAFVVIMLTYTRTQLVLYFFVIIICLLSFSKQSGVKVIVNKKILAGFFLFLLLISFLISINIETLYTRFFEAPESSTTARIMLSQIAIDMFLSSPIIGVGWNNFTEIMPQYDTFRLYLFFRHPAHNMYLLVLAETGLFGFLSYMFLFYVIYKKHKIIIARKISYALKNMSRAAFISILVMLITGLQGWSFRADSIQAILWIDFAIIAAVYDYSSREKDYY